MLRRRRVRPDAPAAESSAARTRRLVPGLVEAGWTLPAALAGDRPPIATRIGVDGGPGTGVVDGRGAVSPGPGRPTLDWAVGADDRWYVPATEPGVEQVRIDHAPVVETRLRVPGGHVVHRAYVARGAAHPGGSEWVVVEVENASKLPVALAWLVRPWDADGLVGLPAATLAPMPGATDGSAPWQLWAGDLGAVLPRRPSRWAATGALGDDGIGPDPLATVLGGDASADWSTHPRAHSDAGLASLALLVPVPHTASATIVVPQGVTASDAAHLGWPGGRPEVEAVVRGWSALVDGGPRIELPDPVLADAVAAARRSILLAHRVERQPAVDDQQAPDVTHVVTVGGPGRTPVGEQMEVLEALAWWGQHDAVDRAMIDWPAGQQRGGGFGDEAATAAALRALAAHAVAAGDAGPARAWLPEVAGAVEWLGRRARRGASAEVDPLVVADGLDAGALLFAVLDQPQAAAAMAADAARARGRSGADAPLLDVDAPATTPRAVAAAAVAATRSGADASAVWALLRRASSTWTWSDPGRWVGDDGLIPARLLTAVARLLVDDRPDGLAVTTWMPPAWWGLGWEVHDAPTRWGRLSYAVRWHSGRPALLWDRGESLGGISGDPVLTAPGLDPSWSTTERRGEVLLAPVAPPEGAEVGPAPATGGVAVAAPPRSVWRPQDPGPDAPPAPRDGPTTLGDDDPGASFL
jgi:hypothetical protein